MQPCYGIKEDRLNELHGGIKALGVGDASCDPQARVLLSLAGLKYTFSYSKMSLSGNSIDKHLSPSHLLDDGLQECAIRLLKFHVRNAKSRVYNLKIQEIYGENIDNSEWLRWQMAWHEKDFLLTNPIKAWLDRYPASDAWLKLSMAVGINSLYQTDSTKFIFDMIRKPIFPLHPGLDYDQNIQLSKLIKSFERDHSRDFKEM